MDRPKIKRAAKAERPAFAKGYPDDEDLLALVAAFEAGNYRKVRVEAPRLAQDAGRPEAVRSAARDLRERIEPDRMQIALLVIAAALVLALSGYEIANHAHAPAPEATPSAAPTVEHIR